MKSLAAYRLREPSWLLAPDAQRQLDVLKTTDEWTVLADGKHKIKPVYDGFMTYLQTIRLSGNFDREFLKEQCFTVGRHLSTLEDCHSKLTDLQARLYRQEACPTGVHNEAQRIMLTVQSLEKELSEWHVWYKLNYTLTKED